MARWAGSWTGRLGAVMGAAIALGAMLGVARAAAEPPRVVADIAPVHSLAAQVMAGVATPELLLPPVVSPHAYAMRPSDARRLAEADLVLWIGPELTPWLGRIIANVAPDARTLALGGLAETHRLPFRSRAEFADTDGHDRSEVRPRAASAAGTPVDPHFWLDPGNAALWLDAIAAALAVADPANGARYRANAAAAKAELAALEADIVARLAPLAGRGFVVFHDAYRYFEARFGIEAAGAIALGDSSGPGPKRLAEIRRIIGALGVACVFGEPQFDPRLIETATEGTGARIGELDPLGRGLAPGPALYPELMRGLADGLADCLGQPG